MHIDKTLLLNELANYLSVDMQILNDNFELHTLGTWDSLAMINMLGIVDEYYKLAITIDEVLQCNKIGDIFNIIENKKYQKKEVNNNLPKENSISFKAIQYYKSYVASSIQERFWYLHEIASDKSIYNLQTAIKCKGKLNLLALEDSVNELIKRHFSLRTIFYWGKNILLQEIVQYKPINLTFKRLSFDKKYSMEEGLQASLRVEIEKPFDLTLGPLYRFMLFLIDEESYVLLIILHHSIADYRSMTILVNELSHVYNAFLKNEYSMLSPLSHQYIDYAGWQRKWMKTDNFSEQLHYWKQHLVDTSKVHPLPTDRVLVNDPKQQGNTYHIFLESDLINSMRSWCHTQGITLFSGLLAIYAILLHCYSQQETIIIGSPLTNRNHPETKNMIGPIANLLAFRIVFCNTKIIKEIFQQVWNAVKLGLTHSEIPYDEIVKQLVVDKNS
ncbi:MAG: condensation domain-containing protein, partial [Gammaproteobacteria bacterium]